MNTRILDLIKNPEILKAEDLSILAPEIERLPYMQSLRAIYLLGIHQFRNEDFQQELTKTAAYTTDKKILYHFINQKQKAEIKREIETVVPTYQNIDNEEIKPIDNKNPISEQQAEKPLIGIDFYTKNQPQRAEIPMATQEKISPIQSEKYEPKASIMDFYAYPKQVAKSIKEEKTPANQPIDFYQKPIAIAEREEETIPQQEENVETPSEWQPMNIDTFSAPIPQKEEVEEEIREEKFEQKIEEEIAQSIENKAENITKTADSQSNVPQFINTWQNWLNATPPPSERDKKLAIIDRFIENNPKMPPANEEVEFVVKEKSDDISHLMTETLAQLYWEQKLYSKAINAYKILQEKYPERTEDFEEKIQEIKKNRK